MNNVVFDLTIKLQLTLKKTFKISKRSAAASLRKILEERKKKGQGPKKIIKQKILQNISLSMVLNADEKKKNRQKPSFKAS